MLSTLPHLAILLPPTPRPGPLAEALLLARTLSEQGTARVTLGLPTTAIDDWEDTRASLRVTGVGVRPLVWTELLRDEALRMFGSALHAPSDVASVMVPHDRARSFVDCDGWILFGDATLGATAWLRPTLVVAPQMAERYVAAFSGQPDVERRIDTFLSWRLACAVLACTEADRGDIVSFAGVRPDHVHLVPPLCYEFPTAVGLTGVAIDQPAIVWHPAFAWPAPATTAAMAWREYLEVGGKLPLRIVGRHADAVVSAPAVAGVLNECSKIGGSWQARNILPGRRLDRLLDGARILWNPCVADDGHWLMARALARGIPAVAAFAPHLRGGLLRGTTAIPNLFTYAADDVVAAATALLTASTAGPVGDSSSLCFSQASVRTASWSETLAMLQVHVDDG